MLKALIYILSLFFAVITLIISINLLKYILIFNKFQQILFTNINFTSDIIYFSILSFILFFVGLKVQEIIDISERKNRN